MFMPLDFEQRIAMQRVFWTDDRIKELRRVLTALAEAGDQFVQSWVENNQAKLHEEGWRETLAHSSALNLFSWRQLASHVEAAQCGRVWFAS